MRRILVESSYAAMWRDILEGVTFFVRERRVPWQLHCMNTAEFCAAIRKADGALCVLHSDQREQLEIVRASGVPAVNMLRDVRLRLPSVLSDHEAIGAMAADYFLARGFQRFAFLGPDRDWSNARMTGFRRQLQNAGRVMLDANPHLTVTHFQAVSDARTARNLARWIQALPRPVAVFAAADFVARGALEACLRSRLRVPEDVAILGVDNDVAICELAAVSLSSIPQNLHRIGFEASRLLAGLLAREGSAVARRGGPSKSGPRKALLVPPRDIVVRRSTEVFAFQDPHVRTAMRLIHAQPAAPVSLKEVLRQTGASRQWLDRKFKELLGRTAAQEIRRLKLERVRALLLETHLPIHEIARRCGFGQSENMTRFFRELMGVSPREYRLRQHPATT